MMVVLDFPLMIVVSFFALDLGFTKISIYQSETSVKHGMDEDF